MIRHRINPIGGSEHAYCGEAFDAFDTGCCDAIRAIRANLRGVKLAPSAQKGAE